MKGRSSIVNRFLTSLVFIRFCTSSISSYEPFPYYHTDLYSQSSQSRNVRRIETSALPNLNSNLQCSMCKGLGLPIKTDVYPLQDTMPNTTCEDLEFIFSLPEYKTDCLKNSEYLVSLCCEIAHQKLPVYSCINNIQNKLFDDSNNILSPPYIGYGEAIQVELLLSFQSVEEIDVKTNSASIYVYLTMTWNDPRLAWNVTEDLCNPTMTVRASINAEQSQIWVPEVDLLLRTRGVQEWPEVNAKVNFDGTVVWQRTGPLTSVCSFRGLIRMPFDTLGCQFIFGRYSEEHLIQFVANPGLEILMTSQTYKEYKLNTEMTQVTYLPPALLEGQELYDRNVIIYDFYFDRSFNFYVGKLIVPSILFTYISFGLFFLDVRLGERLGFGISILLVNVAQDIITNEYIPISQERLWLVIFIQSSTYWIFLAIFETILISWVYYKGGRHLVKEIPRPQRIAARFKEFKDDLKTQIKQNNAPYLFVNRSKQEIAKDNLVQTDDDGIEIIAFEDDSKKEIEKPSFDEMSIQNHAKETSETFSLDNKYIQGQSVSEPSEIHSEEYEESVDPKKVARCTYFYNIFHYMTLEERIKFINQLDRYSFKFCWISYTLFLLVMFLANSTFDEVRQELSWIDGIPISGS